MAKSQASETKRLSGEKTAVRFGIEASSLGARNQGFTGLFRGGSSGRRMVGDRPTGAGEGIRTLDPNLGNRTRPLFRPHLILSQSPLQPSNKKAFLAALHALSILFIRRETPSAASPELPRHLPGSSGKQNADFRNESRAIAGSHRWTRGEQNGHNPRTFDLNISDRAKKSKVRNGLSLRWMSQPSFFCSSGVLRCLPKTSPCFPSSPSSLGEAPGKQTSK